LGGFVQGILDFLVTPVLSWVALGAASNATFSTTYILAYGLVLLDVIWNFFQIFDAYNLATSLAERDEASNFSELQFAKDFNPFFEKIKVDKDTFTYNLKF
jgi:hypothetical protein